MSGNKRRAIFQSFRFRVFSGFALCLLLMLLLNWLLNSFAFSDYYTKEKQNSLIRIYESLNESGTDTAKLQSRLQPYTDDSQITILLWDDYQLLYSNQKRTFGDWVSPFVLPNGLPSVKNGAYVILNHSAHGGGNDSMSLFGKTDSGLYLLLRLPVADLRESTGITNRFLLISAAASLFISCILLILLTRSWARPISRLSEMAHHMAQLDFTERYTGTGQDELSELGHSLNTVSDTMQSSLSELKTANNRLLSDMEQKEQQNEARSRFISNVSHELKTPISLIQTYAEGLQESIAADPESRAYYCKVIEEEAQHLSRIIGKLTMLMQLESGKEELQIDRFDIHALLNRLLERYAPLFEEHHISPPSVPETPCHVWGDAVLIENVMTNYLTNALHHVCEGGVIRITTIATDHQTQRIAVFNSGAPLPEEDLPHIWESFYKVDKAHTRTYGGAGIGLSVVAAIMNAHHMPYAVHNTKDGVEFSIELETR